MRRTKEEASATRERLLDCAELAFVQHGVAGTTLQAIAAAAGLTRGAVYHHFADKPALIEAMLARVDMPLDQAMLAAEARHQADPLAQLRQLALEPLALLRCDLHARRVFTILLHRIEFAGDTAALLARHQAALGDCQSRFERLFTEAQRRGRLAAPHNPHNAALALVAMIVGLLSVATLHDDPGPACDAAAVAVDALLSGLSRPA
jgi:TetR/AcrR family acrAB operon transcriptional repressor